MKRMPWRGALYLLLLGYLFLDFKVINGPIRNAMRSRRDAAIADAAKNGWAALVNLEPVTREQLDLAVARHLHQRGKKPADIPEKNLAMIRRAVLQGLIDDTIIRQYADGEKFEAPETERQAFADRWRENFSGTSALDDRLAAQGLTPGTAADELGKIRSRTRWLEKRISPAVPVTEKEAREWFVANGGGKLESSEAAPGFIEPEKVKLRYRVFATEAEARAGLTEADSTPIWVARDRLDPALKDLAAGDPGLRPTVKSARGWVAVEVLETRSARPLEFPEVRAEIIAHLRAERAEDTVRELLEKYRKVANLQVFPENL